MALKKALVGTLSWLRVVVTWQNILRAGGFFGLLFLVVMRERPEPLLIIACCAMMGLPSFWEFDRQRDEKNSGGKSE
jgi:hypothetical protein